MELDNKNSDTNNNISPTPPKSIMNNTPPQIQVYSNSKNTGSKSPIDGRPMILLGDIIEIDSPENPEYHQQSFIIIYIDERKMRMFNIATKQHSILHIDEDTGKFTDESVVSITLLDRSEDAGFARQNGLYVHTWIDVYFAGELPAVITGEITNLDEDCIEITTFPDIKVIYIDFGYRGLPEDLPIDKIVIRDKPASMRNMTMNDVQRMDQESEETISASMEMMPSGEMVINVPENAQADNIINDRLKPLLTQSAEVVEEDLEELEQVVEIAAYKKRYTIDTQINAMADKYTAELPPEKRTTKAMLGINRTIARFKQLRDAFSVFDANENIIGSKRVGPNYKPVVEQMTEGKSRVRWTIPVVQTVKEIVTQIKTRADLLPNEYDDTSTKMSGAMKTYAAKEADTIEPAYDKMVRDIYDATQPVYEPKNKDAIIFTSPEINENIEAIVDNGLRNKPDTPFSSSATKDGQTLVPAIKGMQRFIRGASRIQYEMTRAGGKILVNKPIISGEKYYQKSLIVFPKSVMRYFRVADRYTNMKIRANLALTPFYYFRALDRNIMTKSIEQTQPPLVYKGDGAEEESGTTQEQFMKTTQHIVPVSGTVIDENTFRDILNIVFPDTRQILNLFRPYFTGYSFLDVTRELTPMGLNTSDITFKQYLEIRHLLKTKTGEMIKHIQTNRQNYQMYIEAIINKSKEQDKDADLTLIPRLFGMNAYMKDHFKQTYMTVAGKNQTGQIEYLNMNNTELILRVLTGDDGNVFYNMCKYNLLNLRSPEKIALQLSNIPQNNTDNTCKTVIDEKRIAKHYSNFNALYADNGVREIFYDKDKDDTPYSVLKPYAAKMKELNNQDEFLQYLKEVLISKHATPPDEADELAQTLVRGRKLVKEGDWASVAVQNARMENDKVKINNVLESKQYFRRVRSQWMKVETDEEIIGDDTNALNCNKEDWCFYNKKDNSCETMDIASMRMRVASRNQMMKELNDRVEAAALQTEEDLKYAVKDAIQLFKQRKTTENVRFMMPNNLCYSLAKQLEVDTATMMESPYAKLLTKIMGVADYYDKCSYLQKFKNQFCREPMVEQLGEDAHWYYCIDTNLKLVPQSVVLINNTLSPEGIQQICDMYGTLEGNMIVDKYTGWKLLDAQLEDDNMYDEEGRKIKTNDVMAEDIGNILMAMGKKEMRVFTDPMLQKIYNVFRTLSQSVGIKLDANEGAVEEMTLRITSEMMTNKNATIIASEDAYKKRMAKEKEKQTKSAMVPYPIYLNQMLVLLTASSLFIAIQTMIPNFRTSKTFAGCVRAFGGYPLTGVENTAGLLYLACIIKKVSTSVEPWNGVHVLNADTIKSRMQMLIQNFYISRSDIAKYYELKLDYVRMHPVDLPPEETSVEHRWPLFQPPIVKFTVKSKLEGVSLNIEDELIKSMQAGSKTQHALIHGVRTKIMRNVYGLVEMVNASVFAKEPLLVSKSNVPFMDNACCNDFTDINPLVYFAKSNPEIDVVIKRLNSMMSAERYPKMIDKAPFIFHDKRTSIVRASIPVEFDPVLPFAAVIKYCNFDTNMPIPREYYPVCAAKPENYSPHWSLEEKVEFLRANGKNYTMEHLYQLMKLVNDRNLVALSEADAMQSHLSSLEVIKPINQLRNAMAEFRLVQSTVFPKELCDALDAAIADYNEKVMVAEQRDSTIQLKVVLNAANEQKMKKIVEFMRKYSNINRNEALKVEALLGQLTAFVGQNLANVAKFIKTVVNNICAISPSRMVNDGPEDYTASRHWGFAPQHQDVLYAVMNGRRDKLKQGKGKDPFIQDVIKQYMRVCKDLIRFIDVLPVFEPIRKQNMSYYSLFNEETYMMLFNYCVYTALHEYIAVAYERQVIAREVPILRRDKAMRENAMAGSNVDDLLDTILPPMPNISGEYDNVAAEMLDLVAEGDNEKGLVNVGWILKTLTDELMVAKKVANMPYSQIVSGMDKTKAAEKRTFIEFFENFEDRDERKAADLLKQFRLGRWAEGFSSKVTKYDKNAYDKVKKDNEDYERVFMAAATNLGTGGAGAGEDGGRVDAEQMAHEENVQADDEWMHEAADISGYGEDFEDGNYYPEDQE